MAALALNQDQPEHAVSIAQLTQRDLLTEQIKLQAMCRMGVIDEVIRVLWLLYRNQEPDTKLSSDLVCTLFH